MQELPHKYADKCDNTSATKRRTSCFQCLPSPAILYFPLSSSRASDTGKSDVCEGSWREYTSLEFRMLAGQPERTQQHKYEIRKIHLPFLALKVEFWPLLLVELLVGSFRTRPTILPPSPLPV